MTNDIDTPATGLIADNVIGFARALRTAGLPIGPGAVIDALKAMRLIDIGNRADLFTTLESIFVKRREHALVFAQAFDLFFRRAEGTDEDLLLIPIYQDAPIAAPSPGSESRIQALTKACADDQKAAEASTSAADSDASVHSVSSVTLR